MVEPIPASDLDLAEYPRGAGEKFRRRREVISRRYFGRTRRSKQKILWQNAAQLYKISVA